MPFVAWREERDAGVAFHVEEILVLESDLYRRGAGCRDVHFGLGLGSGISWRGGLLFGARAKDTGYAPCHGACRRDTNEALSGAATFSEKCCWW